MSGATPRVVGVVLARLDSRRLPGKVLAPLGDRTVIDHVLARAGRARGLDQVVVATTDRDVDRPLADHARAAGVEVVAGSTDDVVGRVLAAAAATDADWIVRCNGDSPFLDPALVDAGVARAVASEGCAIVSNLPGRTYPYGIAVEVVSVAALAEAHPRMDDDDREHVTRYLYARPGEFAVTAMAGDDPSLAEARLVVDTAADLERARAIVAALGDDALDADHRAVAAAWRSTGGDS